MEKRCAWCSCVLPGGEVLEERLGSGNDIVSHGICNDCMEEVLEREGGTVGFVEEEENA